MSGNGPGEAASPDFEETLAELEEIVRALDRREMDLDEALALFERGVDRLRTASQRLDEAEGRVEELIEDASGTLREIDLDPGADEPDGEGG